MNYIPIKLDKTRNMLLGFGAMQTFKAMHGTSLMKLDWAEEDMEDVFPLIIYVGLKHEDSELTPEKTVELIDKHLGIKGMMELMPKIMKELGVEEDSKNVEKAVE